MPKRISSIKPREDIRRGRKQQENSRVWYVSLIARLILIAVLIFIAVNVRIYYNQRAELLNREVANVQRQIHELDREIENLKKRKETLASFENVSQRNRVARLGLRHADPSQIRRTVLVRQDNGSGTVQVSAAPVQKRMPQTASVR